MTIEAEYIDFKVKGEQSLDELVEKTDNYGPDGVFVTIKELHGSAAGARIRAKAKGWSLVSLKKVRSRKHA